MTYGRIEIFFLPNELNLFSYLLLFYFCNDFFGDVVDENCNGRLAMPHLALYFDLQECAVLDRLKFKGERSVAELGRLSLLELFCIGHNSEELE